MKTIPTLAMALSLALSIPACTTTTSSPAAMKSSVMLGNPAVVLRHPYLQVARDREPESIQATADPEATVVAEPTNETSASVMEKYPSTSSSMGHLLVSIFGQIAVACATYGHCS